MVLVALAFGACPGAAHAYLYYGADNTIERAVPGTDFREDRWLTTGAYDVTALTVDGQHLYWAAGNYQVDTPLGTIGRVGLAGTGIERGLVPPRSEPPVDVAVSGSQLFWVEQGPGVFRASLDGTDATLIATGRGLWRSIETDGRFLYAAAEGFVPSESSISRMNLDGSGFTPNFIPVAGVDSLAARGDYLYWTNPLTKSVGRARLDGTGVNNAFVRGIDFDTENPNGIAVDRRYIYWSEGNRLRIGRANLDGTKRVPRLLDAGYAPFGATGLAVTDAAPCASNFTMERTNTARGDKVRIAVKLRVQKACTLEVSGTIGSAAKIKQRVKVRAGTKTLTLKPYGLAKERKLVNLLRGGKSYSVRVSIVVPDGAGETFRHRLSSRLRG